MSARLAAEVASSERPIACPAVVCALLAKARSSRPQRATCPPQQLLFTRLTSEARASVEPKYNRSCGVVSEPTRSAIFFLPN